MGVTIMKAYRLLLAPVLLFSLTYTATAESSERSVDGELRYHLTLQHSFYVCVKPESERGAVGRTKAGLFEIAPSCSSAGEEVTLGTATIRLDANSYLYDGETSMPRANRFGDAVAKQVYDLGFPRAEGGDPVTTGVLYEQSESLGWMEVEAGAENETLEGAIAVWPGMCAIVISEVSDAVTVLYPSHNRQGRLRTLDIQYLTRETEPKFLIPRAYYNAQVKRRIAELGLSGN